MQKFELHIDIESSKSTVVTEISKHCQLNQRSLSNSQIKQAINKGALWLSRGKSTLRLRKIKKQLSSLDKLHFYFDENVLAQTPDEAILIQDLHDYSIWYKPYGMLSQGSKWSDHCTIARWAETQLTPQRPAFIVHRLDRAASGLIIIAHSKKAAQGFSRLFEQHQLDKYYQVIVHGKLNSEDEQSDSFIIESDIDDKPAKSIVSYIGYHKKSDISLLQVKIETGRKHQIRKHVASIYYPVVGDRLHGDQAFNYPDNLNLQLCAVSLAFDCPLSNERKSFDLPNELMPNLSFTAEKLALINKNEPR